MRPVSSKEIREAFLDFFAQNDHLVVASSSLVPEGDPTLLFTSAGMVQFKPYFAGERLPPQRRLASCQKCFRTTDIDRVGDESHLTFFEMLGNFSIGDYFKEGAISLAWEFVTERLGLSPDRLWVTIYLDDDEAYQVWREKIGLPEGRILRFGKGENWWGPAGESGPCGPDSEIFYDRGVEYGCGRPECGPNCPHCERYLEIWNLVFMQYHQQPDGELLPLPEKNIDTGMGLERTAVVMQNVPTAYETDLFASLVARAEELTGARYGQEEGIDRSLRIIAEHSRAATFLITDGVMPANEGRGYVLRRILRKAIYHARRLGREEPFLGEIAEAVSDLMSEAYPELAQRAEFVAQVMEAEEERFQRTLEMGAHLLTVLLEDEEIARKGVIPGEEVFQLYDTYGLPIDFTREIAAEKGFIVDEEGFEAAMAEQQERARVARGSVSYRELPAVLRGVNSDEVEFVGYETLECEARIVNLARVPKGVDAVGEWVADGDSVGRGEQVQVVLDKTPFYSEAGGQVGDTGVLIGQGGQIKVTDTQSPLAGFIVHHGVVEEGTFRKGDIITAKVDRERRFDIMRNHTATHLLHKALREVLGEHARQSGSLVAADRLRFDFTHMAPLTPEERLEIERRVNARVRENLPVQAQVMSYDEALASGAIALFGEKYGEQVRVVSIGHYTKELCAGTHLQATGQIGSFSIVEEGSVGAGLRRLEALTGRGAEEYAQRARTTLTHLADLLQAQPEEVEEKVLSLLQELRQKEKEIKRLKRESARDEVGKLAAKAVKVEGVTLLVAEVRADSRQSLRGMVDILRERLGSAAIVLATLLDGKPALVTAVTPDLEEKGLRADLLIKEISSKMGGSGGGRPLLAEGGGGDPKRLAEALGSAVDFVSRALRS